MSLKRLSEAHNLLISNLCLCIFRDTQASIKVDNPSATFGEISKIVASMWDSLSDNSKQVKFAYIYCNNWTFFKLSVHKMEFKLGKII